MILATTLLVLQLAMLAAFFMLGHSGAARYKGLHRDFGPAQWFIAFYLFWFVMPQTVALFGDHFMMEFSQVTADDRLQILQVTQGYLVLFLGCVLMGFAPLPMFSLNMPLASLARPLPVDREVSWTYGLLALATGLLAFVGLAALVKEGEARSEAVGAIRGQVLYALSFFGSFGFAYLAAHLWRARQWLVVLVLALGYTILAFSIGARGRVLWPLVFVVVFVWASSGRRLSYVKVLLFCVVVLGVLSILDPLFIAIRLNDASRLIGMDAQSILSPLLFGRNFDGLGGFATVAYRDLIPASPGVLLTGARELYMNTYFPAIYARGVGFPPTVPGEFWIAGGLMFLMIGGVVYGAVLGCLDQFVRRISREEEFWMYIVLIPWVAAVGGALTESLAKMLAAVIPILGLMAYRKLSSSVLTGHVSR